jgi:uncharacterized protein (DUF1697 family)
MLRGINVGGHNRVAMADLRSLVADLGYAEPSTYLQSGNLVFRGRGRAESVAQVIEEGLAREFGVSAPVVARSGRSWRRVVEANPLASLDTDPTRLHVTFLAKRPEASKVRALVAPRSVPGGDRFEVVGAEVYLHCPGGYGRTDLDNSFFEKGLGTVATTRNWRTVLALAEMAGVTSSS